MKKNIWIFNHYATDMYKNKGGRHYWFSENLIKKGYKPTLFAANTYHNKKEYINTNEKKYKMDKVNDITFVFVKTSAAVGNGISRVKNMFLFYLNLFSVTREYAKKYGKPDIIIASSVHPLTMLAGIQIAKKMKIPCVCEVRDLWPEAIFSFNKIKENSLFGKVLTKGEHWVYKNSDKLIFTKEGDTDYILEKKWNIENGGDIDLSKCHYINNGVDLKRFDQQTATIFFDDEDLKDNSFKVIYTGAIRPVNDIGNILDTARILRDESIKFLIYGDGNELDNLKARVKDEKLTNVKFKGYVNKKYVPYILSKSSINLLNYSQKQYNWARGNSSNKLFEYMASGKPIIANIQMGYSIIKKYNCGVELSNNSPEKLAYAILYIKNISKEKYITMGTNARKGAKDFDFEILTKKLIKVIESV